MNVFVMGFLVHDDETLLTNHHVPPTLEGNDDLRLLFDSGATSYIQSYTAPLTTSPVRFRSTAEVMWPVGYDANLQEPMKECAPLAAHRCRTRRKLDGKAGTGTVQGGTRVYSPLPPSTWLRGSPEGAYGICSCPNGLHH